MNKHISQNMRHMISLLFWRNAVYWISGGADFLPPSLSFRHSSLSCQINRFPTRMRHPAIGRYRSDIQGLRAIAVVSVVLYHSSKAALPGGYIGVDVVFVISGYLISKIIINENEKGVFSISQFYRRPVRRIFTALYVMLFCVLLAVFFFLSQDGYKELSRTAISTIFLVSNFYFMFNSGYFAGSPN